MGNVSMCTNDRRQKESDTNIFSQEDWEAEDGLKPKVRSRGMAFLHEHDCASGEEKHVQFADAANSRNKEGLSSFEPPITIIRNLSTQIENNKEDSRGPSNLDTHSTEGIANLINLNQSDNRQGGIFGTHRQSEHLTPGKSESRLDGQCTWTESETFTQHEKKMSDQSPSEILPTLYLGSKADSMKDARLQELKITNILSVASGKQHEVPGCKLLTVAMADNGNSSLDDVMKRSFGFIEESQKDGQKLLIHCHLGQNRSPTLVIAWLMTKCNMNMHKAYLFVKTRRSLIHPSKLYIKQLRDYDKHLNGVYSVLPNFLSYEYINGQLKVAHEGWTDKQSLEYRQSQKIVDARESRGNTPSTSSEFNTIYGDDKKESTLEDSHKKEADNFDWNDKSRKTTTIFLLPDSPDSPTENQGFVHIADPPSLESPAKCKESFSRDSPIDLSQDINDEEDNRNNFL